MDAWLAATAFLFFNSGVTDWVGSNGVGFDPRFLIMTDSALLMLPNSVTLANFRLLRLEFLSISWLFIGIVVLLFVALREIGRKVFGIGVPT